MIKELPNINIRSNDWIELRVWLKDQVDAQSQGILKKDITEREADFMRGKADAFRAMLAIESRIERKTSQA